MRKPILLLTILLLVGVVVIACGSDKPDAKQVSLAPSSALPPDLQKASVDVQEAYRFAIANKELLEQIPCFCGCNSAGHSSNYACYVAEDGGPGVILQFDSHALG